MATTLSLSRDKKPKWEKKRRAALKTVGALWWCEGVGALWWCGGWVLCGGVGGGCSVVV